MFIPAADLIPKLLCYHKILRNVTISSGDQFTCSVSHASKDANAHAQTNIVEATY